VISAVIVAVLAAETETTPLASTSLWSSIKAEIVPEMVFVAVAPPPERPRLAGDPDNPTETAVAEVSMVDVDSAFTVTSPPVDTTRELSIPLFTVFVMLLVATVAAMLPDTDAPALPEMETAAPTASELMKELSVADMVMA
jgi:hypothetical protein